MIEIHLWLFIAMIAAILLLGMMLWNNLRERKFHVRVPDLDCFEQALPSIAGMTKAIILDGNRAEILQNGDGSSPRSWRRSPRLGRPSTSRPTSGGPATSAPSSPRLSPSGRARGSRCG